ncbi:MAG: FAD-dependent oxidoreductase [Deltaproteobacteria bacterium]|nr:FAD-dependent oxidoreductase [Deltaproteobacteria bacterium]
MQLVRLFEPCQVGGMRLLNRVVMPSMGLAYTDCYEFNERFRAFYMERARGGAGMITVGPCGVDTAGSVPMMIGLFDNRNRDALGEFLAQVHRETSAKVCVQLLHMGRYALSWLTGEPCLAPSAIPSKLTGETPKEMDAKDLDRVREAYAEAARRAVSVGFDAVEVLACTGYLMSQFLSPVTNQRTDGYGGSEENRMRFPLEVLAKVREAAPGAAVGVRIAGNEFMPGGNANAACARFAAAAEAAGADWINVTGGWHETNVPQLTSNVPPGAYLYLARGVKEAVSVPVFGSNRLGDPLVAERALRAGMCDLICWGRPLLADPGLPDKARAGKFSEITPCIACNQGCFDTVFSGSGVTCVMNPACGRELEGPPKPVAGKKRIFVAGAGPAGLMFARTAAERGHQVTVFEASDQPGGQMRLAQAPPGKAEFGRGLESLVSRAKNAGVDIRLNEPLTADTVQKENPALVVCATGAKPLRPPIPGADLPHVVDAWDVLSDKVAHIGKNVVIVGGSATGCETAHWVASLDAPDDHALAFLLYHNAEDPEVLARLCHRPGRNITVVDMLPRLAANVGRTSRWSLLKSLRLCGVSLCPDTKVKKITQDAVVVEAGEGERSIPADTVILAVGAAPENLLARELQGVSVPVTVIGDARAPRSLLEAIREGYEAGLKV